MHDNRRSRCWTRTQESWSRGSSEFYSTLNGKILVGIEATGSMQWFLGLMEELGIECRVGHPAKIRKAETRKQKHDRRDARLLLTLLAEHRFPTIWMPSTEQRDSTHAAATSSSVGTDAVAHTAHAPIDSPQPGSAVRPFSMEPSRPTGAPSIAAGTSCKPSKSSTDGHVSSHAGVDR
jgi:hypothetical protein